MIWAAATEYEGSAFGRWFWVLWATLALVTARMFFFFIFF